MLVWKTIAAAAPGSYCAYGLCTAAATATTVGTTGDGRSTPLVYSCAHHTAVTLELLRENEALFGSFLRRGYLDGYGDGFAAESDEDTEVTPAPWAGLRVVR